jgi:hypothetical protein
MAAIRKTENELRAELEKLQSRIVKLKKRIADAQAQSGQSTAEQTRKKLKATIEFIADFDLLKARAINISDSGICFETSSNLPFEMRYQHNGQTVSRRAHLIWVKHKEKSGYNFGLKFVNKNSKLCSVAI